MGVLKSGKMHFHLLHTGVAAFEAMIGGGGTGHTDWVRVCILAEHKNGYSLHDSFGKMGCKNGGMYIRRGHLHAGGTYFLGIR